MKMKKNPKAQQIKGWLTMKGVNMSDIARVTGNSPHTVGTIVNYYPTKKSYRIQRAIALVLNKPYEKIWGDLKYVSRDHKRIITSKKRVVND